MTRTLLPFRVQREKLPKKSMQSGKKRKIVKTEGKSFKYKSTYADTWMRTNIPFRRGETDGERRRNE